MSVVIRRQFEDLSRLPDKMVDRNLMREIGLMARERIIRRTVSGKDSSGQPFEPYSEGYRLRKAKELEGGTVNLQVSGAMLNGLTIVDVTDRTVTLGFTS